jgi:fructose-bisphosphate aldolase class 1
MNKQALEAIAQAMVANGKGILAADESTGTIKKRFDTIDANRPRIAAAIIAKCFSVPKTP